MHLRSIERFDFDSVLLPYNYLLWQIPEYTQSFRKLVAACKERGIAVQTIKSIARRPWKGERARTTWYEPLEEQADIPRAVHWVLGDADVFLNSASDVRLLPRILSAARQAAPRPSDEEMQQMVSAQEMALIFD
jgi:hypothetical protein